ncbi:dUTP diphosphatase [Saccharophagus sp. K07]|jgi:dimeric dUTPase (all-alpha-NTP-PPase superfamily)|uniref:dUTP diphosphatase n=1 Tax=Saccharophagus sp. K07 TaxID=2283636 RepID=UPI001651D788|nr:dUTP diphosphatase [Saccharophagus sp. K07]MBC6904885.1 dUTP diphosphatase [Saccharophagus sp. K07]
MKHKLLTMLQMQDEMNTRVHPVWREQGYEWYRAIWVECAELMDHYGWKWWKKQSPDRDQVVLELIDIWHFGLSDLLKDGTPAEAIAEQLQQALSDTSDSGTDFRLLVEAFAQQTLVTRRFDPVSFHKLLLSMDISVENLYRSYVGKNVLNFFRQDKGYKEGSYVKVWNGQEDNVHLVEILDSLDSNSPSYRDDVYVALLQRYPV